MAMGTVAAAHTIRICCREYWGRSRARSSVAAARLGRTIVAFILFPFVTAVAQRRGSDGSSRQVPEYEACFATITRLACHAGMGDGASSLLRASAFTTCGV